jgi:hypothetical protein
VSSQPPADFKVTRAQNRYAACRRSGALDLEFQNQWVWVISERMGPHENALLHHDQISTKLGRFGGEPPTSLIKDENMLGTRTVMFRIELNQTR